MSITLLSLALFCAAAPPVETSKTPETMLYVRTTPSGAEILLDEKPLGTSPGLFKVPPGVRRVVVELDGYEPGDEEVTIKAGHIARVVLRLTKRPGPAAEASGDPVAEILRQFQAAAEELDVQKLEAMFLPPHDPRAGQAWQKSLEEAKKDWPRIKSAGATMQVQFVGTKQWSEGKDRIVTTTIVARATAPDGSPEEWRGSVEIRITPTKEGWKIAEMTTDETEHSQPEAQRTPPAKAAAEAVFGILKQFEAAVNEMDFKKLEALFLPPDDTPAGKSRRSALEEMKEAFSNFKSHGATVALLFVAIEQEREGKDTIARARMVARIGDPSGGTEKGDKAVQFRITSTPDGWKIAEMTTDEREPPRRQPALTPAGPPEGPTAGSQRQRRFVRLVVGKDGMTFEGLETSWEELPALLEKVPNPKQTTLRISFDPAVPHQRVTEIVDLVGRLGFIRLELTAPAEGKAAAGPPAATPEPLSFGPVIEQVLKDPEKRVAELLDLDTGRWARSTEFGADDRKTHQWIREHKVDAMGAVEGGLPGLLLFDMAVYENPGIRWEVITAGEVVNHRWLSQIEPEPITALGTRDPAKLPLTCLFETREGSKGVLQLVGLSDDGQGVKIRYKLVEHAVSDAAADERAVRKVVLKFAEVATMVDAGYATAKVLQRPVPLASGTVVAQMDDLREVASAGLDPAEIRLATVGRGRALVVTEFAQLKDPKYPNRVCMVYTLVQRDGGWFIDDIDLEDVEGLAGELRRFDAEYGRPGKSTQD